MPSRVLPFAAALLSMLAACVTAAGARKAELARGLDGARISRPPAEIWLVLTQKDR